MSMNFSSSLKTPRKNPKVPSKSGCKYKGVFLLPQTPGEKKSLKNVTMFYRFDF
jgi:hypothetical protein